ncbi:Low temperature viability protein [Syncephalis pseudoplumigaleata]|uniref:Low temperature viability protein n=1 Tax=Syncephalis pseudoplumigaleata TaxID=1712513 RepID=A0A4P9YT41_9FUNG|nr:Low temperature viability protein [Syncephalis pseudoplumigaleata]|eukprot:RKP23076.1 Low temperature viability protein [Syncephalis pseudoplumigaleata]
MVKKKFIDKKAARHFHLVHRSQRDPLIADAEASDRVFKEVTRGGAGAHRQPRQFDNDDDKEQHVGQAALYGVYLDDSEYDYTQHLRPMGNQGAVFIEAPSRERKEKKKSVEIKDDVSSASQGTSTTLPQVALPAEVLPSSYEMAVGLMNQPGVVEGLQPDMDPELREALEALDLSDDEEDVQEEAFDDDLIAQLDAEADETDDPLAFDVVGDSDEEGEDEEEGDGDEDDEGWEKRFMRFKQARAAAYDEQSEDFDRQSMGTGFSMSSSAMFRNDKLTMLDEQFERARHTQGFRGHPR